MPTHYSGSEDEVRALDAFIKLMRASSTVRQGVAAELASVGLTDSQLGTLESLYHLGPLSQKEICQKLLVSGGNVTMVVDNLEKRGLVERRRDEHDRRYVNVHLTDAGRELMGEYFPRHAAAITREFSVLEPEEQEQLARLCRILGTKQRP